MAKRYMGEGDPVLDALYEELNATGRKNRTDRRKRRQLERQIRDIRAGRLGGLRGGLRGLFDNLSLRKYPVPASATAAASTLGLGEVIGEVIGEAKRKRIRVPSTVAEVAPEIEEIEVTAERRPERIEAEPKFDIRSLKLGRNQISTIKKRRRTMERHPDVYRPDYAIKLLPDWMKDEYRDELLDFAASFSPHESQRAPLAFDPHGRRTTPAGQYAKGKKVKKSKKSKARKFHEERMAALAEFDPTDPERYMPPMAGLTSLGGKAGVTALIKAMQSAKHRLPRLSPQFTGADDWLTLSEQLARAKGRSALTALRPTVESAATAAEREMMREVLTPLSAVTGATILNAALAPVKRRREEKRNLEEFIAGNEADRQEELAELLALSGVDVDGMSPEIQALIEAEQAGGYAQGGTLTGQADRLSRAGRGDDTMLMHVTPEEVQGLASLAPGMMTINPETGLPEAGLFGDILGFAAPFLGSLVGIPPWAMSAAITAMKGGDLKDMAISGGISALGTKAFEGMADTGNVENLLSDPATFDPSGVSITGAVPEHVQALAGTSGSIPITIPSAVPGSLSNIPSTMGVDALTKAGLGSNLLAQGTAGADPMTFLETAGATPKQLGIFKETFAANNPFDWKGATPSDRWGAVKGGGFGGVKDAIFTPEGISFTALKSLELQNEGQEAFEDYLLAMEEQRKQRERDIEAYYPENFPIDALAASGGAVGGYAGGGSIYKDRYINGNWS